MTTIDNVSTGIANLFVGPGHEPLRLFPRKIENLFDNDQKVKLLLPSNYPQANNAISENLKALEYNFYPDLNTKRKVTAYVTKREDGNNIPQSGDTVYWKLDESSPDASLSSDSSQTNEKGFAEIELKHPQKTPDKDKRNIKILASLSKEFEKVVEIVFRVCRNDDVGDDNVNNDQIYIYREADLQRIIEAKSLLVFQSTNRQKSNGTKALQTLLNQVVARHKASNAFKWLSLDGEYGAFGKTDVKEFLTKFKDNFDYEKGHFNVKFNKDVQTYIEKEYGSYTKGEVVDRDLLIGESRWREGNPVNQIDGLLDIYNGVVECFFNQMVDRADEYTNCNTFWLHKILPKTNKVPPVTNANKQGSNRRYSPGDRTNSVVVKTALDIYSEPGTTNSVITQVDNGAIINYLGQDFDTDGRLWFQVELPLAENVAGPSLGGWIKAWVKTVGNRPIRSTPRIADDNLIQMYNGELNYLGDTDEDNLKIWYKVQIPQNPLADGETGPPAPPVEGWISSNAANSYLSFIYNDRSVPMNAGTFGCPGVAYTFGGKDRPGSYEINGRIEGFSAFLNSNNPNPSDIRSWYEYLNINKPGKYSDDSNQIEWIGCDCAGFVQNCVTYTSLPDGTRIVPEDIMKRIGRPSAFVDRDQWRNDPNLRDKWPWEGPLKASEFVDECTRPFDYYINNKKKQWLQLGDIFLNPRHVVFVADRNPDAISGKKEFLIYNAYGGDSHWGGPGGNRVIPEDQHIRKVIRMPFKWWGIKLQNNDVKRGRIYFWK
jgi:hypothetical protein